MSRTSDEAATESGFDNVISRVWNALDVARRELSSQRDENNILRATRNTFRRRRRAGRMTGIPSHDLQGAVSPRSYAQLSWTLPEFNNQNQSFPTVSLNVIGFNLARADKSRVLTKIQANTPKDLRTAVGRSRVYIIPQTNITLPLEISEPENTHTLPEPSPPNGPETVSQSLPATSSSTQVITTSTASSTAVRSAASASAPPAIYVGPSPTPSPSPIRPPASPAVSQVTPPAHPVTRPVPTVTPTAATVPASMNVPLATSNSNSQEASLDPAQWLNAGTPEVFYRWTRVEPQSRSSVNDFVIDDSEDEEHDDITALALESDSPPPEEMDLAIILGTFQEDHLSDGMVSTICVRRKKLLESAIKALSRVTFSWTHTPHIEFVGEEADDMGGPQREFFRLLMIEVQTSLCIFEGKAGQVFLSYNQAALDQRKYFKGGNLIAWSVAHGGPCIRALDPSLFQLMCGQEPQLEQFDWHVLPDPDVQNKVKRILQCRTTGDLTALQRLDC
ncbi:uncharacterized protein [Trachinotus anak]|uniref:uncharacterized protein isoform X2 n=1 Tax=Trachinotus anak TaxID=443729 RepID=UPI0039F240AB